MKYIAPRLDANDDQLKVAKLYFKNGDLAKKGDVIADLESTKTTFEIIVDIDMNIYYYFKEGEIINVGEVLAEQSNQVIEISYEKNVETIFTKSAEDLINKNNLNKNLFLSQKVVRSKDVKEMLEKSEQNNSSVSINLHEKYPFLNDYKYIPVANIEYEYDCTEVDSESFFWEKLFNSDLPKILSSKEIHNFIYTGENLYLYPIEKSSEDKDYRFQLNNAALETFRGNIKLENPNICVSFLKSNLNFKHSPLLYKNSIMTIGVAEITSKEIIRVNICYDHRYIDGYTILKTLENF
jgi:hypothetical protein